jgi:hypothetical protein
MNNQTHLTNDHAARAAKPENSGGYYVLVGSALVRSDSLSAIFSMLERIEIQLSTRQDKVIRNLMEQARSVLREAIL